MPHPKCEDTMFRSVCRKSCGTCLYPDSPGSCHDIGDPTCSFLRTVVSKTVPSACKNENLRNKCKKSCKACPGKECYEYDIDYPGNDLRDGRQMKTNSAAECQKLCQADDRCVAFTWVDTNPPEGHQLVGYEGSCWIKHKKSSGQRKVHLVSGNKSCDIPKGLATSDILALMVLNQ